MKYLIIIIMSFFQHSLTYAQGLKLHETGDTNDRTRYLEYTISDYLLQEAGMKEDKLTVKAFWNLDHTTEAYRGSEIARNIEILFQRGVETLKRCEKSLQTTQDHPSGNPNAKDGKSYTYISDVLGNWDIENYQTGMELYFDQKSENMPLASCSFWTNMYRNKKAVARKGKGVKLGAYKPKCKMFEKLKQCTTELYKTEHKNYAEHPVKKAKPPISPMMIYVETGVWPK